MCQLAVPAGRRTACEDVSVPTAEIATTRGHNHADLDTKQAREKFALRIGDRRPPVKAEEVYDCAMIINTPRLRLRCWEQADRDAFAAMHADPEVMQDYGGPISRRESDAKLDRYAAIFQQHGFCRWAIESRDDALLGYAGIMPSRPDHPIGSHIEIGWRLMRHRWGYGYATEAARAALNDAFTRFGMLEVIAYTAADNLRSQAVMTRLQMQRDPSRDFTTDYDSNKGWRGLVWVARDDSGSQSE
jgi:RimJ/RimL family protein N-acetyltransferase